MLQPQCEHTQFLWMVRVGGGSGRDHNNAAGSGIRVSGEVSDSSGSGDMVGKVVVPAAAVEGADALSVNGVSVSCSDPGVSMGGNALGTRGVRWFRDGGGNEASARARGRAPPCTVSSAGLCAVSTAVRR